MSPIMEAILRRLAELGVATAEQIEQARREQATTREPFSALLVRMKILRAVDIAKRLAPQLGLVTQAITPAQVNAALDQRIAADLCRTHRIVPVLEEPPGQMVVASDDPFTLFALEWLGAQCGAALSMVLVSEQDFNALLTHLTSAPAASPAPSEAPLAAPPAAPRPSMPPPPIAPSTPPLPRPPQPPPPRPTPPPAASPAPVPKPAASPTTAGSSAGADEPIIQLVDSILAESVRMRASDIHIEPLADRLNVRYRIDGVLHQVNTPPKALQGPVTSRIKIMAGLNIAEKRLPQDGRIQITAGEKPLDVRLSTLPALHGESIVMRLLDRSQSVRPLSDMGFPPTELERWDQLMKRPYGMILVTGPTGSGKTTTLYATLAALNRPDRKLITIEDPVEYQLAGINQVHVKTAVGLTFAAGLRAMLRQAPDVIMIGEIRDQETAQIAVQAALTGHLVFSTLHTNDACSAVTRLIDMGVAPFLVASTVQGVLAQRLVRRICSACRATRPATPEEQLFLGEPTVADVAEGRGCEACHQSGYLGRLGIYELLMLTDSLRQLIVKRTQASNLRAQAVAEGMRVLRDDGRLKVREGVTTMAEILRATPESEA